MFIANTNQIRQKASQLEQLNGQFSQAVNALVESEASLASMWEGDAQKSFREAFNNDRQQFEEFFKGIGKYVQALRDAADNYDKAESKNVELAKARS